MFKSNCEVITNQKIYIDYLPVTNMCLEDYLPKGEVEREIYEKVLAGETLSEKEAHLIGEDGDNYGDYPYKYAYQRSDAIGLNGVHSVVLSISPRKLELVTKVPRYPANWWKVERGKIMQTKAHELGVKVARPEGIYRIFDLDHKKFYSGFVMEHLGMLPVNEIRSLKEQICTRSGKFESTYDSNCLAKKLMNSCTSIQELHEKALQGYESAKNYAELKGFSDIDYRETNAFWVPDLNDIRMIDCDEWNYYNLDKN